MTKRHIKTVITALFASVFFSIFGLFSVNSVHAENEFPIHLMVSPASQTLGTLEPGQTYSGEFTVKNIGTEEFDYKVYPTPYTVQDEEYSPEYSSSTSYNYITEWFSFSKESGHLAPQEEEKISYTVKVPKNATGGAQNAAIMVETEKGIDKSKTVSASSRVGIILYSKVAGDINDCGKIDEKKVPGFLLNPPIEGSGLVENCGNTNLNVRYTFTVTPIFSKEPAYTNEDSPTLLATLPGTKRHTTVKWESSPKIGIYKVNLKIDYAGKTEEIKDKVVIICPLWVIILVIVFIAALIFWLVSRAKERRGRHNRHTGLDIDRRHISKGSK